LADGTSSTTITATLVTSTGAPAADGITVTFTTDLGRFTTDGAKTATATAGGGTGTVLVPFISEKDVVGTATIVANVESLAQSIQIGLTGAGEPDSIILTADSTTISIFGTTGISAQVLDDEGNPVTDGTAVFFTTSLAGTGVTPTSTTVDGFATTIFSAGTLSGVATVTASSGSASATISITIESGPAGSLEFVSAVPTIIGVLGSALPQKSTITFRVRDVNGNPVADGTLVTFTLISGVGGGETLGPTQVGTTAGLASTVLTSGTVSGPVRVQASVTVGSITLTSSSTNVSIAGGAPSGAHFGVFPRFLNVAGLVTQGMLCDIDATVADRFGNPVPVDTAVSFFTNGGIVDPQGLTDEHGNTPGVTFKTGNPTPHVGTLTNFGDPRTGLVTMIAVTQGEETFIDANGNGLFDDPQEFDPRDPELDTPEPFIDHITLCNGQPFPAPCPADPVNPPVLAGDNQFNPSDRFELFFDGNQNGRWDLPNGVWDADKAIFASTRVLFTGPTRLQIGRLQFDGTCCLPSQTCTGVNTIDCNGNLMADRTGNPNGFCVPDGGTADRGPFCFIASDPAGRPLVGGTSITVTTTGGTIAGSNNIILPDTQEGGPGITLFSFTVSDDDPDDPDPETQALVTINVSSPITSQCPGGNGNLFGSFGGSAD
jgi:adhesin/invasin